MEYGIWSLNVARGLWGDRSIVTPPDIPQVTQSLPPPSSAFALNAFPQIINYEAACRQAVELLTVKTSQSITSGSDYYETTKSEISTSPDTMKKSEREGDNNENNIEIFEDETENNQENDASPRPASEELDDNGNDGESRDHDNDAEDDDDDNESCAESTNSSNSPGNVDLLLNKPFAPVPCFGLTDKDETAIAPIINGWVLGAYTAMLGTLSAAAANTAFKATGNQVLPENHWQSDSESESDHSSSYTEKSTASSNHLTHDYRDYPCSSCNVKCATKNALRKHIVNYHSSSTVIGDNATTNNEHDPYHRDEIENHIAAKHVIPGTKKKPLSHQRVRYRYEREEYKCTLCSYACTIEKAFQRHLRAHAKGVASIPKTRVSCAVCGADRSSEVDLSRHMRRHRDDRYFCCDICVFRTVQLKKLIQHRRMHTGEKPHLCPHCAYRSARRDNLRSHVRRVHKKENLYCDTFSPRGLLLCPTINTTTQVSSINNAPSPIATVTATAVTAAAPSPSPHETASQ